MFKGIFGFMANVPFLSEQHTQRDALLILRVTRVHEYTLLVYLYK